MSKINIKKGDNVIVLAGESRGEKGRVLSVDREKQRVLVEGVNIGWPYQNRGSHPCF